MALQSIPIVYFTTGFRQLKTFSQPEDTQIILTELNCVPGQELIEKKITAMGRYWFKEKQ